jgi:GT2 family glycosyltransferase
MKPTHIVIHHSATAADTSVEEIRRAHLDRGFDDIGYHYLVLADGSIVKGRPEGIPGAHARGVNQHSIGVCCIGNFQDATILPAQLDSLVALVVELALRYQVRPEDIVGHCDVKTISPEATPTECPGARLYECLPLLRLRVVKCTKPEFGGSSLEFLPVADGLLRVRGVLRGRHYQHSRERMKQAPALVRLSLSKDSVSEAVWVGRGKLYPDPSEGGGDFFTAHLPQDLLEPGRYHLQVSFDEELAVDAERLPEPILCFSIVLPLTECRSYGVPPMRAMLQAQRVQDMGPFIIRLKGTVTNTGTEVWRNDDDQCPFRVGAMAVSAEQRGAPLLELRYDLPFSEIAPGCEIPFSFTFDTGELPLGGYFVHVDVVQERRFWFAELGGVGDSIRFEVTEQREVPGDDYEHLLNPPNSWAESPDSAHILYVAPTLPLFDRATGGRRLVDIFKMLREMGVAVTYLYEQLGAFTEPEKYIRKLDELGVVHSPDPIGFLSDRSNRRDYNLCVLGWYYVGASVMPAVRELLPGVRVAIDSNDIHWEREVRSLRAGLAAKSDEQIEVERQREKRVYAQSDEVWVVSDDEVSILAHDLPSAKYRVVGIPSPRTAEFVEELTGDNVLFVGGFSHLPNESAALWASEIVETFNSQSCKSVVLDVVGSSPPKSVLELAAQPHVRVSGFVPSLDQCHRDAKVFLAPLKFGGGVKGKVTDAICRGVPVITNTLGNEGLRLKHGEEILLGETTEDFVRLLSDVYSGRVDLEAMRQKALARLQAMCGEEAIRAQLLSSFVAPHVVIGIVTYNQRELLRACLRSILDKTTYPNFTIAVVSNACTDGTVEMLRELEQWYPNTLDVYHSDVNNFFVRPCNQIIGQYPESDILLMNNDVEVLHPGWLTNLVDAAYSARNVCGSGGLVFDSEGVVSEAGAEIYASGMGRNLYRGSRAVAGAAQAIRSVGFVSGCLMYMRRDAITVIGALDDDYHPMYFEDVAWHYTAHQAGLKTIYMPWARIVHKEGSTAGKDLSSGMKRYQEINRRKFLAKFSGIDFERFNYSDR